MSGFRRSSRNMLLDSILTELLHCEHKEIPIECVTDNQSLLETVYSTKNIQDKRLKVDINIAILRNMLSTVEITKVKWIKSSLQLSNCLTKSGASTALLLKTLKFLKCKSIKKRRKLCFYDFRKLKKEMNL